MNSFRACVVFAVALVGGASSVVAGCSSSTSSGGGGGTPAASCSAICARSTAAKCVNDPDCLSTCQGTLAKIPAGCQSPWSALSNCLQFATFTCDARKQSVATACDPQEATLTTCLANPPAATGGLGSDAGTGTGTGAGASVCQAQADDSSCLTCLRTSCCSPLSACTADASCQSVATCATNCTTDACINSCEQQYPSGVTVYVAAIDCSTQKCQTPCGDSGATGTGTTPSPTTITTPAGCYDVPAGTTGYCEGTGHAVIQDCPDGAPYPDCVRAPDGSSGIWCCNE